MNSYEVMSALDKIVVSSNIKSYGVISAAGVNKMLNSPYPKMYVCNSIESSKKMGHWLWVYASTPTTYEVFDSLGKPIRSYGNNFKQLADKIPLENCTRFQRLNSISCGLFCIFMAHFRVRGILYRSIVKKLSCNRNKTEKRVKTLYNAIYKKLYSHTGNRFYNCNVKDLINNRYECKFE